MGAICKALASPELVEKHFMSYIKMFSSDRSWRVRFTVAQQYDAVCLAAGAAATREELLPLYVELLRDVEGEVRNEAVAHVAAMCKIAGAKLFVEEVLPMVQNLVESDAHRLVRLGLTNALVSKEVIDTLGPVRESLFSLFFYPFFSSFFFLFF